MQEPISPAAQAAMRAEIRTHVGNAEGKYDHTKGARYVGL